MTTHCIVRIVAGFFVLLSLSLGVEGSPLFHKQQSAVVHGCRGGESVSEWLTRFCPLEFC